MLARLAGLGSVCDFRVIDSRIDKELFFEVEVWIMKNKKRDAAIELMRVIACFLVICIHVASGFYVAGGFSRGAALLGCLRADAVAFFWFITGAFLFRKDAYGKVLKGMLTKVFAPAFALILFIFLFEGWMFGGQSMWGSISGAMTSLPTMLYCVFFRWATPVAYSGQLWYVFAYVFAMICFPVLKAFVDKIEAAKKEKVFFGISFGFLVLNDISNNAIGGFSHTATGALIPAAILMIWGHFLYRKKDEILKRVNKWYCLLAFLGANILRWGIMLVNHKWGDGNLDMGILYWFSGFGVISTVALFLFLEGFAGGLAKRDFVSGAICKIGSYTFVIYLLHELVIAVLDKFGVIGGMKGSLLARGGIARILLCDLGLGLMVFGLSFVGGIVLRLVKNGAIKAHAMIGERKRG